MQSIWHVLEVGEHDKDRKCILPYVLELWPWGTDTPGLVSPLQKMHHSVQDSCT